MNHDRTPDDVTSRVKAAKRAGRALARAAAAQRSALLHAVATQLEQPAARKALLEANALDVDAGHDARKQGTLSAALVARLVLNETKLDGIVDGLRQLAQAPDLLDRSDVHRELDQGLTLERTSCPLGVLGAVFEARPDAVPQIAGLALRTGNAVVLKGGAEAQRTNVVMVDLLHAVLREQGFAADAIVLLEGRAQVAALLEQSRDVDLIIARGSTAFIHYVQAHSKIPVLGHAEGLCHLFVHASADPAMAAALAEDSKCTYPAACNSLETLLWEPGAEQALAAAVKTLAARDVVLRGCAATRERHPDLDLATEDDWATEYGDLILSIRRVDGLEGALEHIETYGSQHTEGIVASDEAAATRFLSEVDAADVFHNASLRFSDGYRYGLGAEVGISTSKLHARGPVGVEGLVTYRWLLRGQGHCTAAYGPGKRAYTHRDLPPKPPNKAG